MTILLFMKAPQIGSVKTRLAAEIGHAAALEVYLKLLRCTRDSLDGARDVEVRCTPDHTAPEIRTWASPHWTILPQGGGDLGVRLSRAFAEAFAAGAPSVAAIGSDCPYVNAADFSEAAAALAENEVVIGPATDGGYWLIAMNRFVPELFEGIAWSTDQVLDQTLAIAARLGLRTAQLRPLSDVDTLADWNAFCSTPLYGRLEPKAAELPLLPEPAA